jgi:antitoxin component of MazEF toxin-antitoxin module
METSFYAKIKKIGNSFMLRVPSQYIKNELLKLGDEYKIILTQQESETNYTTKPEPFRPEPKLSCSQNQCEGEQNGNKQTTNRNAESK